MSWQKDAKEKRDELVGRYPDRAFGRVNVFRLLDFVYASEDEGDYAWLRPIVDVKDLGWRAFNGPSV